MNTLSHNAPHDILDGELVSPAQAAWYLSVAKNTVYHWLRMGYFPHYRVGKLIRIRLKDLAKYFDDSRVANNETTQPSPRQELLSHDTTSRTISPRIAQVRCTQFPSDSTSTE